MGDLMRDQNRDLVRISDATVDGKLQLSRWTETNIRTTFMMLELSVAGGLAAGKSDAVT